ncbi:uncharacterized protein LOC129962934 [Argiope bruennichi]|uniref:uncharacterized protein LOC129962934 n=1 Tax=Argiope bruennichi TaxID=94029 RepID=UPI0024943767|nr:uncharacterized protein LOC129962934 [Argiope bruennichi]
MIAKVLLVAALAAVSLALPYGAHVAEEEKHEPIPYEFGYETNDDKGTTTFRKEKSDGKKVEGTFGYKDDKGIERVVEYIADEHGYRAQIKTNEPGTESQNPADVILDAKPIVVEEPKAAAAPQPQYEAPRHSTTHEHKYEAHRYEIPAPRYEAPKYEIPAPRYEAPKYEIPAPRYEAPKYEIPEPKYEARRYEAPKYEVPEPKYEAPKYEAPKYEVPKYEAPKYEAPKYEAPKYEVPKYEAPKYEAPKYEVPKYEAPRYEAPHHPRYY